VKQFHKYVLVVLVLWQTVAYGVAIGKGNAPFDQLDAAALPAEERVAGQPKEIVAILGSNRGRHWAALTYLALSPDGKYLVCSDSSGAIRVWDSQTLRELTVFQGHSGHVSCLAFSRDGKVLASSSRTTSPELNFEGEVKLWDFPNVKLRATMKTGQIHELIALAFSPDEKRLAGSNSIILGEGGKIPFVWDLTKNPPQLQPELKGHQANILAIAFTPDGKSVLTGDAEGKLQLSDAQTREQRKVWNVPRGPIVALRFAEDGKRLLSCSRDQIVRIWSWQAAKLTELKLLDFSQPHHKGGPPGKSPSPQVVFMALSQDGTRLASVDDQAVVRLWDLSAQPARQTAVLEPLSKGFPGTAYYHKVALSPDGKTLSAIGGWYHSVRQWDLSGAKPKERISGPGPRKAVMQLIWAKNGSRIVAYSEDNSVWIWDWQGKRFSDGWSLALEGDRYGWDPASITADGKTFAATFSDNSMEVWKLDAPMAQLQLRIADKNPPKDFFRWTAASFDPGGTILALGGDRRPINIFDLSGQEPKVRFTLPNQGSPLAMTFSPNGATFALGEQKYADTPPGQADTVRVYDVATGKVRWSLTRPQTWPHALRFSPDAKTLAVAWHNAPVTLADAVTGKVFQEIPGTTSSALAFSADSKLLATGSADGQVAVWASGEKRYSVRLPGPVQGVAWSPDSQHLATANANGSVFILRLKKGKS
jgi:WD40 repeat protein